MGAPPTTRSRAARDALIEAHVRIVWIIAHRMKQGLPAHVEVDDLAGYGMFGLIEAAERFDPGVGESFVAFAWPRIRGSILDGRRQIDWVPRRVRDSGSPPQQRLVSLELFLHKSPWNDLPADGAAPDTAVVVSEGLADLRRAFGQLTHKQKQVIEGYYLEDNTLRVIGDRLGLSESRVSQIAAKAVARMRQLIDRAA